MMPKTHTSFITFPSKTSYSLVAAPAGSEDFFLRRMSAPEV